MRLGVYLHRAPARQPLAGALLVVIAASLAALIAHVGIDLAGDVLLEHDTYDGIAHDSRALIGVVVVLSAAAGLLVWLAGAWREATGSRHAGGFLAVALPKRSVPFVLAVIACGFFILVGMERADTLSAGRSIDDLGDLLGGSPLLGAMTLAPAGALVALVTLALGRALCRSRAAFVRALAILLSAFVPVAARAVFRTATRPSLRLPLDVFARSGSLRAPPATPG